MPIVVEALLRTRADGSMGVAYLRTMDTLIIGLVILLIPPVTFVYGIG